MSSLLSTRKHFQTNSISVKSNGASNNKMERVKGKHKKKKFKKTKNKLQKN